MKSMLGSQCERCTTARVEWLVHKDWDVCFCGAQITRHYIEMWGCMARATCEAALYHVLKSVYCQAAEH